MTLAMNIVQLNKGFVLHNQAGAEFQVLHDAGFVVDRGECVVLNGVSGAGKSTLLKSLYGSYLIENGRIEYHFDNQIVDMSTAPDADKIRMREHYISYVSQFLNVVPRVSTLDIVKEPLLLAGVDNINAEHAVKELLQRLNIPEHLWSLSPLTFSGGEQQRVNIARGFVRRTPFMLLDEPTASLDARNRDVVVALIAEAKQAGTAIVGIFHDADVRERVADRQVSFQHYMERVTS
ncbi:MAG: phosphonate C-P lyase system protein PhnL [Reinekea sp.]|jgi:alpha-D-ribose 1-methylphosphonate 5-triphosphate synthase subunit PhnL|nr:phosphonate C-P lyase system protein PhnL [Reinekea sp.]